MKLRSTNIKNMVMCNYVCVENAIKILILMMMRPFIAICQEIFQ